MKDAPARLQAGAPTAQRRAARHHSAAPLVCAPGERDLRVIPGLTHARPVLCSSAACLAVPCCSSCRWKGPAEGRWGGKSPLGARAAGGTLLAPGWEGSRCSQAGFARAAERSWLQEGVCLSVTSLPRVFQIPQVLVKLKKYPQGDKVRLRGPQRCSQRCARADGACPDGAGARPKPGEGGWDGKRAEPRRTGQRGRERQAGASSAGG